MSSIFYNFVFANLEMSCFFDKHIPPGETGCSYNGTLLYTQMNERSYKLSGRGRWSIRPHFKAVVFKLFNGTDCHDIPDILTCRKYYLYHSNQPRQPFFP